MGPLPPSLWKHLATLGFIGYLPIAPGTFGKTLAAALFFWLCSLPLLVHLIVIVFVTVIGALAAHEAEKVFNRRDPGEIVIDEFAGYAVSLLFVPSTPLYLAAAFLLFRFFDILPGRKDLDGRIRTCNHPAGPRRGGLTNMKIHGHRFSVLLFLCSTLALFPFLSPEKPWAGPLPSVSGPASKPAEPQAVSEDPLGRSTPYGTVLGFIRAAEREDYQRASRYLEGQQSAKKKEELAALLKVVLDRGVSLDLSQLSKRAEGNQVSNLPLNTENVGVAQYGNESLDILLRRVYPKGAPFGRSSPFMPRVENRFRCGL